MNSIVRTNLRYRSIWISDNHLGTRGCNAEMLLDFLRRTESEYLYLVGDIVDIWRMRKSWYWRQAHNDVVQKLLRKARKGTRVIYIPGNHDENFRDFARHRFGRVVVLNETVHVAADGKRYLVLHGDQFDGVVKYAKWLAFVGDNAYNMALTINVWFNFVRRKLGIPYWSLSAYLKHKVKNAVEYISNFEDAVEYISNFEDAVEYISNFEDAVAAEARRRGTDGVICGHIHSAEIRDIDGIVYCNDGDWVESCTALVEHADGHLEILRWTEMVEAAGEVVFATAESTTCESSSSPTPGILRSMASFARSIL